MPETIVKAIDLPDVIPLDDLKNIHPRQLRVLAAALNVQDVQWQNTATKAQMLEVLTDEYPHGVPNRLKNAPVSTEAPVDVQEEQPEVVAPATSSFSTKLRVPVRDESFVFNDSLRGYLVALANDVKAGKRPMNTLLLGPAGCGKTSTPIEFAAELKMPFFKLPCSNIREARDFFGAKSAENGRVFWKKSLFAEVIQEGNAVICLDEINRVSPNVCNPLLALLDWTGESYVEEAEEFLTVGPNLYIFATANIGASFSGTYRIDDALWDRFGGIIECNYLPEKEEATLLTIRTGINMDLATKLVNIAVKIRNEHKTGGKLTRSFGTRNLLDLARLMSNGSMGTNAFNYGMLPYFSSDGDEASERAQVIGFIQGSFGKFNP